MTPFMTIKKQFELDHHKTLGVMVEAMKDITAEKYKEVNCRPASIFYGPEEYEQILIKYTFGRGLGNTSYIADRVNTSMRSHIRDMLVITKDFDHCEYFKRMLLGRHQLNSAVELFELESRVFSLSRFMHATGRDLISVEEIYLDNLSQSDIIEVRNSMYSKQNIPNLKVIISM